MSVALIVIAIIYILLSYHYYVLIEQVERVFKPLNIPQHPNFILGKGFAFIFLIYGIVLLIVVTLKKLDTKKKRILFWVSLVILLIVGGRLLRGFAASSLTGIYKILLDK